jgi:ankyrin repeat protein
MLIKAGAELPGALGVAVKHGRIDAARALLDAGADVNEAYTDESTGYISTPLILATKENKPELALILVEKGADPSRKDSDGHTALDYAKKSGNESLLAALHAPRAGSPAKKR